MNKSERELIAKYIYCAEERLQAAVNDCTYRFTRRELDSIDLLEEILARNALETFRGVTYDITRLLKLDKSIDELTRHLKLVSSEAPEEDKKHKVG